MSPCRRKLKWIFGICALFVLILISLLGTQVWEHETAKAHRPGNFDRITSVGTGDSRPMVKRYTITRHVYRQLQKEAGTPLTNEALLQTFNIAFSDDTYARYFPGLGQYVVHQTPANHARIRRILKSAEAEARPPYQFRLMASMLSLPSGSLREDRLLPNGEVHGILKRYGADLNHVIAAPEMVLEEGREGEVSSVREYHLPVYLPDARISSDVRLHGFSIKATPEIVEDGMRITGSVTVHPLSSQRLSAVTTAFSEPGRSDLDFRTELFASTVEFDVRPTESQSALILCHHDPALGEQVVMLLQAVPRKLDGKRATLAAKQ